MGGTKMWPVCFLRVSRGPRAGIFFGKSAIYSSSVCTDTTNSAYIWHLLHNTKHDNFSKGCIHYTQQRVATASSTAPNTTKYFVYEHHFWYHMILLFGTTYRYRSFKKKKKGGKKEIVLCAKKYNKKPGKTRFGNFFSSFCTEDRKKQGRIWAQWLLCSIVCSTVCKNPA